jgi:hypothetical protein
MRIPDVLQHDISKQFVSDHLSTKGTSRSDESLRESSRNGLRADASWGAS